MPQIYLTHSFDAGHRIVGHKGKCARLHGHTYNVEVNLTGALIGPGFVVDFGDVKTEIDKWDHMMLLWDKDLLVQPAGAFPGNPEDVGDGIICLPFNPTAENMVADLAGRIIMLSPELRQVEVTLWETLKASATHSVSRLPA